MQFSAGLDTRSALLLAAAVFEFVRFYASAQLADAWQMILGAVLIAIILSGPCRSDWNGAVGGPGPKERWMRRGSCSVRADW